LLFFFLFVIEAILVYGLLHLNHAADGSENELVSQQVSNQSDSSDNERQDSADIESAESANVTSDTASPESVTTSPSDLIQANQTSNMSKKQIKPGLNALDGPAFETLETVEKASSAGTSTPSLYNVKVTFDTMTVNDDHEGTFSGDGEYDVAAYVQGIKILLSDKSGPGSGLWDVSSGETVYFDEGTEVTLQTPNPRLISIFTVGSEKDNGCGSTASFPDMQSAVANAIKPTAGLYNIPNMYKDINLIQDSLNRLIRDDEGTLCGALNSNDILGKMNVILPPSTDRPPYTDSSTELVEGTARDFILKFTVSIEKSPDPVERTEGLDLNKLPELANNELKIIEPKVENYTILSPELPSNQSAGVN
jgi:hypothetical protein